MPGAMRQAYDSERGFDVLATLRLGEVRQEQGQFNVALGGQDRKQIVKLKHQAHVTRTPGCQPRDSLSSIRWRCVVRIGFRESGFQIVVARASRPCVGCPIRTGGTPVPLEEAKARFNKICAL